MLRRDQQQKPLVYVVGGEGVGKSVFVNYMLGHEFVEQGVELIDVKDKTKPHANIHRGLMGATSQDAIYASDDYNYYDCSFSNDLNYSPSQASKAPTLTKHFQLTNSMKAIVCIVSWSYIYSDYASSKKYILSHAKQARFLFDVLHIQPNIIFVLNNQSMTLNSIVPNYPAYKARLKSIKQSIKSDLEKLNIYIAEFNEFLKNNIEEHSHQKLSNQLFMPKQVNVDENLQHLHALKCDYEAVIKLFSLISSKNSIVWENHHDKSCYRNILIKLNQLEIPLIPESIFNSNTRSVDIKNTNDLTNNLSL